jgi:hypothetical protein
MAENWVRCKRCHEVFDAEVGPCTKCGTPHKPPANVPPAPEGLYSERYAADELPALDALAVSSTGLSHRRNTTGYLIAGGAALIISAMVVGLLFALGAIGGANPTAAPQIVVPLTAGPSPTPSLPPAVAHTIAVLSDANLSAQITINSHVVVKAGAIGPGTVNTTVGFDGQVSKGNQWGTLTVNGIAQDIRLINDHIYRRFLPTGKWSELGGMPNYYHICPMFGLAPDRDLQLIGPETKEGRELLHLQSTRFWSPDVSRLALYDLSTLEIPPAIEVLDLWATPDGTPVSATFSGTTTNASGAKIVDIQVSYTFAQVGVEREIDVPGPNWSPSPSYH